MSSWTLDGAFASLTISPGASRKTIGRMQLSEAFPNVSREQAVLALDAGADKLTVEHVGRASNKTEVRHAADQSVTMLCKGSPPIPLDDGDKLVLDARTPGPSSFTVRSLRDSPGSLL